MKLLPDRCYLKTFPDRFTWGYYLTQVTCDRYCYLVSLPGEVTRGVYLVSLPGEFTWGVYLGNFTGEFYLGRHVLKKHPPGTYPLVRFKQKK